MSDQAYQHVRATLNTVGWLDVYSIHLICFPSYKPITVRRILKKWVDQKKLLYYMQSLRQAGTTVRIGGLYGTDLSPEPRSVIWQHAFAHLMQRIIATAEIETIGFFPVGKTAVLALDRGVTTTVSLPQWSSRPPMRGKRWLVIPHDRTTSLDYHHSASARYRSHFHHDGWMSPVLIGSFQQTRMMSPAWTQNWKHVYLYDPQEDRWLHATRKRTLRTSIMTMLASDT